VGYIFSLLFKTQCAGDGDEGRGGGGGGEKKTTTKDDRIFCFGLETVTLFLIFFITSLLYTYLEAAPLLN